MNDQACEGGAQNIENCLCCSDDVLRDRKDDYSNANLSPEAERHASLFSAHENILLSYITDTMLSKEPENLFQWDSQSLLIALPYRIFSVDFSFSRRDRNEIFSRLCHENKNHVEKTEFFCF